MESILLLKVSFHILTFKMLKILVFVFRYLIDDVRLGGGGVVSCFYWKFYVCLLVKMCTVCFLFCYQIWITSTEY